MIEQKENLIGSKSVPNAPKRQHPSRNINKQSDQILNITGKVLPVTLRSNFVWKCGYSESRKK